MLKNKYNIVTKTEVPNEHLNVGEEKLERVESYACLGLNVLWSSLQRICFEKVLWKSQKPAL